MGAENCALIIKAGDHNEDNRVRIVYKCNMCSGGSASQEHQDCQDPTLIFSPGLAHVIGIRHSILRNHGDIRSTYG